ncbi:protease synthase and sporulation negative regulator Pai1 [Methanocaldococcus villosus KIN24-T80]|uniref:Protease synthase and sporulation negative regulator Pai1 n=1 Tax=Methanocaldococcus villosus KIN24-T80 TaxID=1069083 RepID=N6VZ73_9EURY|nr:KEOPS complex subunit Pcc1 [Methanocaldococcus villosus]ENN96427.1 protease synthase and sporulation negative regulator Pai1 [Methanocaldococcus villosus KIN24-T80]
MWVIFDLNIDIPKEVSRSLEIDNYKENSFEITLKNNNLHIETHSIGSLKSILDDFFRCLTAAIKVYEIACDYKIRNVTESDLESFLSLYYKAYKGFKKYYYKTERWAKWYFKWLMKRDKDGFFIIEYKNKPIGFIACDCNWESKIEKKKVAEIHEIFVDPDFRGRGIGTMLINKAIEYAKKRGRDVIELWAGVENEQAKKFYKHLGFEEKEKVNDWVRFVKRLQF